MKIQALIYDGFDEMDIFGAFEALSMGGFHVALKSFREQEIVTAAYGTKIQTDGVFSLQDKPDVLLVPGGGWLSRAARGAWAEAHNGDILNTLTEAHRAEIVIASVCTGALLVAQAGLLNGRPATTNHAAIRELVAFGAVHLNARVVDDGNIITAGGITSSIDLGIWLIERFKSAKDALTVSEGLEFERRGVVFCSSRI